MVQTVRAAAVAGTFYPGPAPELASTVDRLLDAVAPPTGPEGDRSLAGPNEVRIGDSLARGSPSWGPCPKALIVPHAGYIYSGPIAASAFARVRPFGERITRVVLIGPSHRVFVSGLVSPGASRLATPLGEIAVDTEALAQIGVPPNAAAHAREHSLEVELPFIQRVAPNATIVPLAGTRAPDADVGRVLEQLWGGPETLIVISSDLTHYLPYDEGRAIDEVTCAQIVAREPILEADRACGSIGINGLSWVARKKQLRVELVDLRSSGDTAGSRDQVVGYAAFAIYEDAA